MGAIYSRSIWDWVCSFDFGSGLGAIDAFRDSTSYFKRSCCTPLELDATDLAKTDCLDRMESLAVSRQALSNATASLPLLLKSHLNLGFFDV
jgi:hypothetical protein